jgi:hypothetical protein
LPSAAADAGAAAGAAAATTFAAGAADAVVPAPEFIMYSMARLTSASESSAMPPRAGMPPWPLSADCVTAAKPSLTRGVHAARSPIFGAPRRRSVALAAGGDDLLRFGPRPPPWRGSRPARSPDLLAMKTTARSISMFSKSGLPPFAGIARMPLIA